jgi:hypothetical protein
MTDLFVAVVLLMQIAGGSADPASRQSTSASAVQKPEMAPLQPGTATGTMTVGSSKFQLAHAYAFPDRVSSDPAKTSYRVLVTDRPLTRAAVEFAASAGTNDVDRQKLAVELSDQDVSGLELIVGADKRVIRVNVYSPDSALGMMLLEPSGFLATALDPQSIAGKLFTEKPIEDTRIGKTIQFETTFSAKVYRPVR